ncbi:RNA polymerase sigma factor [Phytoactinopolyspora limicola]|uniref:RNA polymerase sigma factor n=1 Tax=Phytoactinopolyspora limicola TaxID=2715536 RepID=UPI00140C4307|nr:sigma-70 family RNA polymerase sigma factor [Phytoactinopolyspora limicola]
MVSISGVIDSPTTSPPATAASAEGQPRERSARPDAELIEQARAGDRQALASLWCRYDQDTLAIARRIVGSPVDADDVYQEAALRFFTVLLSGNGPRPGSVRGYVLTIVRHVALDRLKRESREVPTVYEELDAPVASSIDDPSRVLAVNAFRQLPTRWQHVIDATVVKGLSPHELASALELSDNGTAALALRAREGLRQAYLLAHVQPSVNSVCSRIMVKMAQSLRGRAGKRAAELIQRHVRLHPACAQRYEAMRQANFELPPPRSIRSRQPG